MLPNARPVDEAGLRAATNSKAPSEMMVTQRKDWAETEGGLGPTSSTKISVRTWFRSCVQWA